MGVTRWIQQTNLDHLGAKVSKDISFLSEQLVRDHHDTTNFEDPAERFRHTFSSSVKSLSDLIDSLGMKVDTYA